MPSVGAEHYHETTKQSKPTRNDEKDLSRPAECETTTTRGKSACRTAKMKEQISEAFEDESGLKSTSRSYRLRRKRERPRKSAVKGVVKVKNQENSDELAVLNTIKKPKNEAANSDGTNLDSIEDGETSRLEKCFNSPDKTESTQEEKKVEAKPKELPLIAPNLQKRDQSAKISPYVVCLPSLAPAPTTPTNMLACNESTHGPNAPDDGIKCTTILSELSKFVKVSAFAGSRVQPTPQPNNGQTMPAKALKGSNEGSQLTLPAATFREVDMAMLRRFYPQAETAVAVARTNGYMGPHTWTKDMVRSFIRSLPGCLEVSNIFFENQIDGQALLLMDISSMTHYLKIKLGPAVKVQGAVAALRQAFLAIPYRELALDQSPAIAKVVSLFSKSHPPQQDNVLAKDEGK